MRRRGPSSRFDRATAESEPRRPPSPRADSDLSSLELAGEGPRVDAEAGCDRLERLALPVSCRSLPDRAISHLASVRRARHTSAVQVLEDRGSVDAESTSQRVDRDPVAMELG